MTSVSISVEVAVHPDIKVSSKDTVIGLIASNTHPVHIAGAEVVKFVEARDVELELVDELEERAVVDADVVEFAETLVDAENAEEKLLADPELDTVGAALKLDSELVESAAVE